MFPRSKCRRRASWAATDCGQVGEIPPTPEVSGGDIGREASLPELRIEQHRKLDGEHPGHDRSRQFSKGRICTEVRPIFEIFVPRDCQNPNLAPKIQQRYRKPLQVAKRLWGDRAEDLKADQKNEIHEIYLEALRSLVNYNYMHDQTSESVTITETWSDFDQLPEELQELLDRSSRIGRTWSWAMAQNRRGKATGLTATQMNRVLGLLTRVPLNKKEKAGVSMARRMRVKKYRTRS
jgi:hypothetical protein